MELYNRTVYLSVSLLEGTDDRYVLAIHLGDDILGSFVVNEIEIVYHLIHCITLPHAIHYDVMRALLEYSQNKMRSNKHEEH